MHRRIGTGYKRIPGLCASRGRAPLAAMRAGHVRTMRFLNNLKLIVKIAIPTVVFVAIAIGLVTVAKTGQKRLSLVWPATARVAEQPQPTR